MKVYRVHLLGKDHKSRGFESADISLTAKACLPLSTGSHPIRTTGNECSPSLLRRRSRGRHLAPCYLSKNLFGSIWPAFPLALVVSAFLAWNSRDSGEE